MSYVHATTKLNSYTPAQLAVYAQATHDAVTAAAVTFPTPVPALATFQSDITALNGAVAAWGSVGARGSHADLLNLRAAVKVVQNDMRVLARYVDTIALGSAITVALSGFTSTNPRTPVGVLTPPQNFRQLISARTLTQQAILKWKKPTNVGFGKVPTYVVEYFDNVVWKTIAITSRTKATLDNPLVGATTLLVRVSGLNDAGPGAATAPITIVFMP